MTRTLSILFLFFALVSCGGGGGSSSNSKSEQVAADNQDNSSDSNSSTPAPIESSTFDISAKMSNFSKTQEDKVMDAFELIKKVVASDEFKSKVLNKTYNGKKQFVQNNGLTNSQIYKKILEASEKLTPGKNNTMDLVLTTYYTEANVIGYTKASIKTIYMNRRYLSTFQPYQVAMNLFHEWLHKLGFGHDYESTTRRPHSVPYAIGYIVRDLAKKYN